MVFANSRAAVESYTDLLGRRSEEFVPHHGNLSKDLREHVESRLKDRSRPVTAICTSTLEMGVDIGSVTSVAQLGAPPGVAALRQRLGRSGRHGGPAVLRVYVSERETTPGIHPTTNSAPASCRRSRPSNCCSSAGTSRRRRRRSTCPHSSSRCCRSSPSMAASPPPTPTGPCARAARSAPSTRRRS
ncbi:helicase-related protein [Herbidospora sp. RD11066]